MNLGDPASHDITGMRVVWMTVMKDGGMNGGLGAIVGKAEDANEMDERHDQ
jgi:hypothetical protein